MEGDSTEDSPRQQLHPLVMRIIEEFGCPSPGVCPRDPEQPSHGSFSELLKRRESRRLTDSCLCNKAELFARVQLANPNLTPAPVGWDKQLTAPSMSGILQRRKMRSRTGGDSKNGSS